MSPRVSKRASEVPECPILKLAGLALDAEKRGIKVHRLNIGQPDVHSPAEFINAVNQYKQKVIKYEASNGNASLLSEWTSYLNRDYSIGITPKEMIITNGASEALIYAFLVCCDPQDEILVFVPSYANYAGCAAQAGVNLRPILTDIETNFGIPSIDRVESNITSQTRAILICSPNNPTGARYHKEAFQELLNLCDQRNLFLIVDEVYREFVYDDDKPSCVFEFFPHNDRIIMVDSLSKRFSLCGARVGCIVSWNGDVMSAVSSLAGVRVSVPTIEQSAASYMLSKVSPTYLKNAVAEYKARRNCVVEGLRTIEGVSFNTPKGGFYLIAELPVEDSEDFARFMLQDFSLNGRTVFVAPANGFYLGVDSGKRQVRIAFVLSTTDMQDAISILREGLAVYVSKNTLDCREPQVFKNILER